MSLLSQEHEPMAEGSSSASQLGWAVDVHVCLTGGMGWWALGHLGLLFFNFGWFG